MANTATDSGSASLLDIIRAAFGKAFRVSRGYSASHDGIDIPAAEGTPVYAVASGIVEYAKDARVDPNCGNGWACGGGNTVNIAIGGNKATQYAHLQSFVVAKGQAVRKGQLIGYVGRTGGVAPNGQFGGAGAEFVGAHVHFGLWDHTARRMIDPTAFLASVGNVSPINVGKDADDLTRGPLAGWGGVVSYPDGHILTAKDVEDIINKLETAGFFGPPGVGMSAAGIAAREVVRGILSRHIGQPWSKAMQDAIQAEAGVSANEATATPLALANIAGSLGALAAALLDPTKWLYIFALLAGAAMAAFGGVNVLRAAA